MKASIHKINVVNRGNTVVFVDVMLGETIIVNGFKVVDGKEGRFLSMPSTKGKDEKYHPSVWFNTKEEKDAFSAHILKLAEAKMQEEQPAQEGGVHPDWQE